jgi:uncharacterized protein with GYD domain
MPTYLLLSKLTPEGRKTLHEQPGRIEEVNHEMERLGVRVLSQYALLGGYDFVTILEAPDNETVAHLSVDLGSRGTLEITSFPAIPIADLTRGLQGPEHLGKGAPAR